MLSAKQDSIISPAVSTTPERKLVPDRFKLIRKLGQGTFSKESLLIKDFLIRPNWDENLNHGLHYNQEIF